MITVALVKKMLSLETSLIMHHIHYHHILAAQN